MTIVCDFLKGASTDTSIQPIIHSFTSNTPTLTAVANDISYEEVFSFQLEKYASRKDILICISSSGNSPNILKSIETAKELFDQIENKKDDFYKKRIKRLNSVNWRSKLNYFSFHLSNPIIVSLRNSALKVLVKNNKFLDSYLGRIYKN